MTTTIKFLLISVLIFVLGFTGIFDGARSVFHTLSNPIELGLRGISIDAKDTLTFFVSLKRVRDENLKLREEKENLLSELAKTREIASENAILKDQLGVLGDQTTKKTVLANVIGIPYDNENSEFFIDKGKKDGLTLGSYVVYKSFLVGSVVDLYDTRSVVVLITSPKLSVAVLDQNVAGRTKGLVAGSFGTSLVMDRILPSEEVNLGDTIVTSGQDGVFDSGLLVGKVVEISSDEASPLKKARLETFLNLNNLEAVFVVVKEN